MAEINDGGPAFPQHYNADPGMTLRDYIAVAAMQTMIQANLPKAANAGKEWFNPSFTAACAYGMADAMLLVRDGTGEI